MRNSWLGGLALASAFALMPPTAPALAQAGCGMGHPCSGKSVAGARPSQYRYSHHGYAHGYGHGNGFGVGAGVAAGLAAGAIIGGAMQQSGGYYPAEPYPAEPYPVEPYPVYSDQGPAYVAGPQVANDADAVAYCERTYRSYDPASGTYLGYDGLRHPCP